LTLIFQPDPVCRLPSPCTCVRSRHWSWWWQGRWWVYAINHTQSITYWTVGWTCFTQRFGWSLLMGRRRPLHNITVNSSYALYLNAA